MTKKVFKHSACGAALADDLGVHPVVFVQRAQSLADLDEHRERDLVWLPASDSLDVFRQLV